MRKCRILVPIGCRSDAGLTEPIIRRLEKQDWCIVEIYEIAQPGNFKNTYLEIDNLVPLDKVDLMLCIADRVEMLACACLAFHNNIRIAHVYAGITNTPLSTLDDVNRHVITLYSDIQFCEDEYSRKRVKALCWAIEKKTNVHVVGITHLDDLEVDESLVPKIDCDGCPHTLDCHRRDKGCVEDYDLVLINPTTTMEEIVHIKSDFAIIIGHNPDDTTLQAVNIEKVKDYRYFDNLPRPQFLGLLKRCKRFISNSSAIYYEAPFFLKDSQIIQIGERNKNRSSNFKKMERGASDKIVKILEKWWKNKND